MPVDISDCKYFTHERLNAARFIYVIKLSKIK